MSADDLESFFWTIGASGKRTKEAQSAGCVGMFGIGGFANFGVCDTLEVISQPAGATSGTLTRLSEADIQKSGAAIPSVTVEQSDEAAPRGTIVVGYMRNPPNVDELRRYLQDFVRFVPIKVYFGGQKLPQGKFSDIENRENMTEIRAGAQQWQNGDMVITGRLFADRGHTIVAAIDGLSIAGEPINLTGYKRFENGPIDVFKRGFELCATNIGTTIGVMGRLDCDRFIPTAGRDSLDAPSPGSPPQCPIVRRLSQPRSPIRHLRTNWLGDTAARAGQRSVRSARARTRVPTPGSDDETGRAQDRPSLRRLYARLHRLWSGAGLQLSGAKNN